MPSFTPKPFSLPDFAILSNELVPAAAEALNDVRTQDGRLLSDWDTAMASAGPFGAVVVFPETLNTCALKQALAVALAAMPCFSRRAVLLKDGRVDVVCNNAGARFAAASTSATLADVLAAVNQRPYGTPLPNPWAALWPAGSLSALVEHQSPLSCGLALHLSGGGTALSIAAHHCVADFATLQVFVAHWAAAYNAAQRATSRPAALLAGASTGLITGPAAGGAAGSHGSRGGLDTATAAAGAGADYREALPEDLRRPEMSAARVEALAEEAAPPPGDLPPRREVVAGSRWSIYAVLWYLFYHLNWRGGGPETRTCHVTAERVAELKEQAMRELDLERKAAAEGNTAGGGRGGADGAATASSSSSGGPSGVKGGTGQGGGGGVDSLADVQWVSSNDALVARLMQMLHALPVHCGLPLSCFMAADIRRRVQPPLPAAGCGNLMYSVRLERLQPSQTSVGRLAASVRREINSHMMPQFRGCLRRCAAAITQVGAKNLIFAFCLERDPVENIFAPEGPLNLTRWDVRYDLWQFGPSRPVAFQPEMGVLSTVVYPDLPSEEGRAGGGDGGLLIMSSLPRITWRQLDATGLDLGSAL